MTIQVTPASVNVSNFPATFGSTQSGAWTVGVSNFPATQAVTQSGAWSVGIAGSVAVTGTFWQATQPVSIAATVAVSGPLTDTQLRATPVPISGTVTANTGLTQPLTDAQLRATPVPVSGTVTVDTSLLATAAKQDTGNTSLASIDGKLTNPLPVSGAVTVTGSVTANAGTNLNTSLLALESGGNLADLVAKDFSTEATLALIKSKTDNLDVTLSGGGAHVIVDSMPAVSAQSSALVVDTDVEYVVDATEALTQTEGGRLRVESGALVTDAATALALDTIQPLSLTGDGRLRVVTLNESMNFARWGPRRLRFRTNLQRRVISPWG